MKGFVFFLLFFLPTIVYSNDVKVYEIRGEEVWSGEKIIDGIVAVREKGRLIIKAGTKVKFVPFDYDNDEIGDGELYVEGEIYIEGEKDRPVMFTAQSDRIEPKMWKYVMINHAKNADIRYAIFEGAFSGLQVHFTKAYIKNCIFRKNIDGFRFSTANIDVCGCFMLENKYGVRYEERDSRGEIRFSEVKNNEVGIFPVIKAEGKVNFRYNNIYNNEYNIRVGEEQRKVLTFSDNYFGSKNIKDIKKTIYDKRSDKNLTSVKIKSFLKEKVKIGDDRCQ